LTNTAVSEGKNYDNIQLPITSITYRSIHVFTADLFRSLPKPMYIHCVGESRVKECRIQPTIRSMPLVLAAMVTKPRLQSRSPRLQCIVLYPAGQIGPRTVLIEMSDEIITPRFRGVVNGDKNAPRHQV